ncbi:MAG: D-serine ammonia-lyase [Candidatus Fimivivens sp.]|nr:D-serine ammonia-lyase [Candidatus Fimivivens sp.]
MDINKLYKTFPVLEQFASAQEIAWLNPALTDWATAKKNITMTQRDVDDAEQRLQRFAPYFLHCFPESAAGGLIESPLQEITNMKAWLNSVQNSNLKGRLMLKMDSHLAVAGSVKARGGIYEIIKYAEQLALKHKKITPIDDYVRFADDDMKSFFSNYTIHVGSTGNLGLSIGVISATLGFNVYVHMSADAKQWKKDLLKSKGARVLEYSGDYEKAVENGRILAANDPKSYFVDDENSVNLFLGYAVAGKRLYQQLQEQSILVDSEHPLFVYIPCGVGGAPGGITFGLKLLFKDNVHVFYAEPTQACCMAVGLVTGLHNRISVQDIGLSGKTEADGLAVSRPSKLVGKNVMQSVTGEFTIDDRNLYPYMKGLLDTENIFIEPSSCAAFAGPARLYSDSSTNAFMQNYFTSAQQRNATHIVWATGGSLVPEEMRALYYNTACKIVKEQT